MNRDNSFRELSLCGELISSLERANITTPTQIQRLAIPRLLDGESLLIRSQTGSGKSLAYLLPLLQRLSVDPSVERMLILLPTRELAQQVGRVALSLSDGCGVAIVHGGVEYAPQREAMVGAKVVVATPGRLQDLLSQGEGLSFECDIFVLDEVDQMVDLGFRESILSLSELRREGAQSVAITATVGEGVESVIQQVVGEVARVEVEEEPLAAQRIEQSAYFVEQSMMEHLLLHLLRQSSPARSIIFCRSRRMADQLCERLTSHGYRAEAIHSERSQAARDHIMCRFQDGETTLLVATDLVARGIDVEGVSHVFNFGLPQSCDQYIHRIGRTGRAGASGVAISLLCADEQKGLNLICSTMKQNIRVELSHPYMTPAVSQLLDGGKRAKKRR